MGVCVGCKGGKGIRKEHVDEYKPGGTTAGACAQRKEGEQKDCGKDKLNGEQIQGGGSALLPKERGVKRGKRERGKERRETKIREAGRQGRKGEGTLLAVKEIGSIVVCSSLTHPQIPHLTPTRFSWRTGPAIRAGIEKAPKQLSN